MTKRRKKPATKKVHMYEVSYKLPAAFGGGTMKEIKTDKGAASRFARTIKAKGATRIRAKKKFFPVSR